MEGLRRRVGRSASSRHDAVHESQYEEASDDCSSMDSASDLNEEIQDYDARMARRRAMGGERLGRIRAGMRALSRTILGSRPTGSQDSESSSSDETSGDSESSSIATDEDDSDSGDDCAAHAPSLATVLGFRRRRRPDAFDSDSSSIATDEDDSDSGDDCAAHAPSLATVLGFRRRRRPDASDFPTPRRRGARSSLYDHDQGANFSDHENTHAHLDDEDFPLEEDQPHHRGHGARDPYIPTPSDYSSRSRRDHPDDEEYEDSSDYITEGISSGVSENVRPGRNYGRYEGASVYPGHRRR